MNRTVNSLKKTIFIKNAIILTATSLILRVAGVIFKVWIAAAVGSEGIGLYQLVFSVYVLATVFATSGISTAVTRLVSEELALGSKKGCLKILKRAIMLSLVIAVASMAIIFFGAEFIAFHVLAEPRAAAALRIIPLSLPFMGISSCIRGYFIARRNVTPNAIGQIFEQSARIGIILFLVKRVVSRGISAVCSVIILGDCLAEALSLFFLSACFFFDCKKINFLSGRKRPPYAVVKKILHITAPITSGRYLNTLLRTAENILVPKNLAKYPLSSTNALAQFGMIKGMALPILFFPSAILNAVSTLLIPEMSEASAKNQKGLVKSAVYNIIKLTSLISFIFAAVFFVAGENIGILIYKDATVGYLLKALSPIVPLMYLDSISDGILKGLDQQVFSFRTAISDSVIRIILILIFLPISGLKGFIGIMYFSNFLTCFMNVGRLIKVTNTVIKPIYELALPLACAFFAAFISNLAIQYINIANNLFHIAVLTSSSILIYIFLLFFFGIVKKEELKRIF